MNSWDITGTDVMNEDPGIAFQRSGRRGNPQASSLLKVVLVVAVGATSATSATTLESVASTKPSVVVGQKSRTLIPRPLPQQSSETGEFKVARTAPQLAELFRSICKPIEDVVEAEEFSIFD